MLFLLIIINIGSLIVLGQDIPSIPYMILPEVKPQGTTGYLNCTIARQNLNKAYWIRESVISSEQLVITADDRVVVDPIINEVVDGWPKYDVFRTGSLATYATYTLVVRRLVLSDMGNYTCQVEVTGSSQKQTMIGRMLVNVPPTIYVSSFPVHITVEVGSNLTLTCFASGYPPPVITWCRSSGNYLPPPYNKFMHNNETLTLYNIQPEDRSMYRCLANNDIRPIATYDTAVYVYFRPIVSLIQDSYGQAANRLFTLNMYCVVSGWPSPDMYWYRVQDKSLVQIIDDDRHIVSQMQSHEQAHMLSEMYFHLTILNVLASDYGEYVCEGRNKLGVGQATILVYETSECQGENCPVEGGTYYSGSNKQIINNNFINISIVLLLFIKTLYKL